MSEVAETWVHDTPPAVAPPPSAAPTVVGRRTVLPRVEAEAGQSAPRLVREDRARFEPLRTLGEGGLGVVVAARDLDIGRRVAIKRIKPEIKSQAAFLRFVQEVRTVGQLDHPNITPIHDVGRDEDGGYYFVMKYVEGQTLEEILALLRSGDAATHARWTFERRAELFMGVLHAVAFAHERGIIHRDLKPANVMVGHHGEVQLLDWGIAKQLDQVDVVGPSSGADTPARAEVERSMAVTQTRAGSLIGTPRYMAPEQARGEPADVRTDTWALSLLFYEWLTLLQPFDRLTPGSGEQTLDEVLAAVQSRPITAPARTTHPAQSGVPADLSWFVIDGLERDPAKRYQSVGEMISRLEMRNDGEIPVQCPVTLQKSLLRRTLNLVDRHPFAWTGAVVGLLGLLVVAGLLGAALVAGGSAIAGAAGAAILL